MKDNVLFINNNNYLLYARHCTGWSTSIIHDFCNNSPCRHFISNNSQRGRNQRHFVYCGPTPHLHRQTSDSTIKEYATAVSKSQIDILIVTLLTLIYYHTPKSHSQSLPSFFFSLPFKKEKKNRKKTTSSDTWHGNTTNKLKTKRSMYFVKPYN